MYKRPFWLKGDMSLFPHRLDFKKIEQWFIFDPPLVVVVRCEELFQIFEVRFLFFFINLFGKVAISSFTRWVGGIVEHFLTLVT